MALLLIKRDVSVYQTPRGSRQIATTQRVAACEPAPPSMMLELSLLPSRPGGGCGRFFRFGIGHARGASASAFFSSLPLWPTMRARTPAWPFSILPPNTSKGA